MIKTVFLDLDDTILDFHKAEAVAISATFRELGVEPTGDFLSEYSAINRSCWARLELGELTREEVLVERFRILYEAHSLSISPEKTQALYEDKLSYEHPFMDGGPELLGELFGKYDLYIASNGTAIVQDRRIALTGIAKYFKDIFISQRIGYNKPSREFFDICFSRISGFDKSEAIIIGDGLTSDILGGIGAGIKTCYFNPKRIKNETGITPDFEVHSLSEIPELLERL